MASFHCHNYSFFNWFPHFPWVQPLVQIAACIGITSLRDRIIAIYHNFFLPSQWCRFTVTFFTVIFWIFSMITSRRWLQSLVGIADYIGNYFSEKSNYHYLSWLFFSEHNGVVSPSPVLIVLFWSFSVISPYKWVWPLVLIDSYIGITLLSNIIITIHHHCFSTSTMASFSPSPFLIVIFWSFIWFLLVDDWNNFLGLLITLEINLLSD